MSRSSDIKTDPLITITPEKLSVDLHVSSSDRFVRAFTYTADGTVPVPPNSTTPSETSMST